LIYKVALAGDPALTPTPWLIWMQQQQQQQQPTTTTSTTTTRILSEMLLFVLGLASLVCSSSGRPSNYLENHFETESVRSAAIKRLLEVFGMDDPPHARGHKQAPQYMLDLYNTVADVDGMTKDPDLLEGNTVRSFFDKCKFNAPLFMVSFFNGRYGVHWDISTTHGGGRASNVLVFFCCFV